MAGLQVLEDQFGSEGFRVLGFYSNDFGNQGGSEEQIEACNDDHGVSFLQFETAPVIGADARPVFAWILSQPDPANEGIPLEPNWNFHKYLISRTGELVAHYGLSSYPGDSETAPGWDTDPMVVAIKAELAKR